MLLRHYLVVAVTPKPVLGVPPLGLILLALGTFSGIVSMGAPLVQGVALVIGSLALWTTVPLAREWLAPLMLAL